MDSDIETIYKRLIEMESQITKIIEQHTFFTLPTIKEHKDLIDTLRKDIDELKAKVQGQEQLAFLKHPAS